MLLTADIARGTFNGPGGPYALSHGLGGAVPAAYKREGDGATPYGRYRFEFGFYRADRMGRPACGLALSPISPTDGWCDDPSHSRYNQPVHLPFDASHETLTRSDALYDLLFVITHNRWPAVPHYGSAIFMHVAIEDEAALKPTRGCLALKQADLLSLARFISRETWLIIK